MNSVDLERSITDKQLLLLNLKNAVMKLHDEALALARKPQGGGDETRPIFDTPVTRARNDVKELMQKIEQPPFSELEKWRSLYDNLVVFVKETEDVKTYQLEGYAATQKVETSIDELIDETKREHDAISK